MVKTFIVVLRKVSTLSHYSKSDLNTEAAAFYYCNTHVYCMLIIGNHRYFKTCEMVIMENHDHSLP